MAETDIDCANGSGFEIRFVVPGSSRNVVFGRGNLTELHNLIEELQKDGVNYDGSYYKPSRYQFKIKAYKSYVEILFQ